MKENNLIKILIPIIALVVVFESIVLVSNLDKGIAKSDGFVEEKNESEQALRQEVEKAVADFVWETETNEMKVGKSYNVTLNLLSKQDLVLDSIESRIYFDPKMIEITQLVTNKNVFGQDLKPQIDNKEGYVGSILWSGDKPGVGYEFDKSNTLKVLSFMVTPKLAGKTILDLSTTSGDGNKSATIIVETNTSKTMPYSSSQLEINIMK